MIEQDLHRYAVAVMLRQLGMLLLNFPTSNRAHPSACAYLQMSPKWSERVGYWEYFPMRVRWDIWEGVLVPVLRDETLRVQVERSRTRIELGDYKSLLDQLTAALGRHARLRGFLPAEGS
jgi:hypothetical protein